MGFTPGEQYCDLCGRAGVELRQVQDGATTGRAPVDICRTCQGRRIVSLIAVLDSDHRTRPRPDPGPGPFVRWVNRHTSGHAEPPPGDDG